MGSGTLVKSGWPWTPGGPRRYRREPALRLPEIDEREGYWRKACATKGVKRFWFPCDPLARAEAVCARRCAPGEGAL